MPRVSKVEVAGRDGPAAVDGDRGVMLVERTVRVLAAFGGREAFLSLAALSAAACLHKSTALRIARTLARAGYLVRTAQGQWRLGPEAGRLGARYQDTFDVNDAVTPLLRGLARTTGESASLFVREGHQRTCLLRVESAAESRPAVRPGTAFPLAKGAPGRVILAFSGQPGEPYEAIRRRGYHVAVRERAAEAASVAAPVFGSNWQLLGAISLSGPASRLTVQRLEAHAAVVIRTARAVSQVLGGTYVRSLVRSAGVEA